MSDERDVRGGAGSIAWYRRRGTALQLGLVALLVTLFVALGIVVQSGRTLAFDERAHRVVRGHVPTEFEEDDTSFRTSFMHFGVDFGTATILFVPLTALVLWHQRRRRAAAVVILSVSGALAMTLVLKAIFQRTRYEQICCFIINVPNRYGIIDVFGYLYPSTHTVLSVVSYGLIAAVLGGLLSGWRRAVIFLFVILLVGFIGGSLVYLNTHYLTDVLGGLLIGGAWLIMSLRVLRALETR